MFRAILFDFDGVLADTEPVHFQFFAEIVRPQGILLTREDYDKKYLGLDDRTCFRQLFRDVGKKLEGALEERLVREKNRLLTQFVKGRPLLLPGVRDFLMTLQGRYYLAIVSGALKREIELILGDEGLQDLFHLIVGAEEVSRGKPDPEGFVTAIKQLNRDHVPESEILLPQECLAVEDSPWGIEAAKRAGVKVVAVTHSYPREKLLADQVVDSIGELSKVLGKLP